MPSFKDLATPEAIKPAMKMMGRRQAAEDATNALNMRKYKPRRPEMTMDDVVTPEIRAKRAAMMQDAKDQAMQPKIDAAYEGARTTPFKNGGSVGSASKRADGCAVKGKTKGRMI
jgi:hypothetical protein